VIKEGNEEVIDKGTADSKGGGGPSQRESAGLLPLKKSAKKKKRKSEKVNALLSVHRGPNLELERPRDEGGAESTKRGIHFEEGGQSGERRCKFFCGWGKATHQPKGSMQEILSGKGAGISACLGIQLMNERLCTRGGNRPA